MNFLNIALLCWDALIIVWLIFAFTNKRTVKKQSRTNRAGYVVVMLIGVYLLFYSAAYPVVKALPNPLILTSLAAHIVGLVLVVAGMLFAIWARFTLGKNWSGVVTLKQDHQLIKKGPYAIVRHPIYTGILFMALGTACIIGLAASFVGTIIIYLSFLIKSRQEEAYMQQQFPDQYPQYKKSTKGIIPFVL